MIRITTIPKPPQPVAPRDLATGQLVTATHPWTGHAITGRWNADHAHIEVDRADNGGCYRVTVEQLAGFTFTTA